MLGTIFLNVHACMDKGSSLNLDLMISGNYVMIMIMLMTLYV